MFAISVGFSFLFAKDVHSCHYQLVTHGVLVLSEVKVQVDCSNG